MTNSTSDIGLIGLAVMGQNLALNIADHDFKISVYNRTFSKTKNFLEKNSDSTQNLIGFENLEKNIKYILFHIIELTRSNPHLPH